MINILHTIETRGPGGAEILLVNIAKHLEKSGYKNFGFFIKEGWLQEQFLALGFTFKYARLANPFDFFLCFKLFYFVVKNKICVIHAHEFTMAFYSCLISIFLPRVKVVCTFHGRHYHSDTAIRQKAMRFVARRSKMVAVSADVKNYIATKCSIFPFLITEIENGIDIPPYGIKGTLREEIGLPLTAIIIGAVGRLHKIKGHQYLIEAAERISKGMEGVYFVIAGEGAERLNLELKIRSCNIEDRFILLGNRDDIDNILRSLDIFVLPSLSEGTSLALLEAMAHGLSIIATNVGNNYKLLSNCSDNIIISVNNTDELYNSVAGIIESGNFKHKSVSNREKIIKSHSIEAMVGKYERMY